MSGVLLIGAAKEGLLNEVPRGILTVENLVTADARGETALHWAAIRGYLNQVRRDIITSECLTVKDSAGLTPLHWAAYTGHLG